MFKKITLSVLLSICISTMLWSQVGIGTTDPKAMLDIQSSDNGILIPRVELTETSDQSPITAPTPEVGLMVFNTATINDVTPGFYYWNGTAWERMGSGDSTAWALTGNAGTNPGTAAGENFIGTSDTEDFIIATDGTERIRVLDNGQVGINENAPFADDRFTVQGEDGEFAINGYTSNGGAVYGNNTSGTGWGVLGESSNIGVEGFGAYGVIGESYLANAFGMIALNTNANGTGMLARGNNSLGNYLATGTGIAANGASGIFAYGRDATGTGVIGVGNNDASIFTLSEGSGLAGTGFKFGVFGYATETGVNNNNNGTFSSAGGYFANAYGGYSAVSGWWDPIGGGNNDQVFKIIGNGSVSTIVKRPDGESVIMFAPESPEVLFQDYGIGKLINGKANIKLDPILVNNIRVDDDHPLKVFIQLEGDCNGVYVTNKSVNGFDVIELQGGSSNVSFSWSITATRADETFIASDGSVRVSNNGKRFPIAPKMPDMKRLETKKSDNTFNFISNSQETKNKKN